MRILVVSNLLAPEFLGGYELIAEELATRFADAGHDVAVVTSALVNHRRTTVDGPFAVYRTLRYSWLSQDRSDHGELAFRSAFLQLDNIAALVSAIEEFQPDRVLLCNIHGLGALGIVAFLHMAGFRPAIYLGDNVFEGAGRDPQTRDAFFRLFRVRPVLSGLCVMPVSKSVLEETEAALTCPLGVPLFVPGWVTGELRPVRPRDEGGAVRFVFASRVAGHKGVDVLLDAVRLMLNRGEGGFVVEVFGAGEVPAYVQRVHALGLSGHIRYVGLIGRDAMIERFGDFDALLFPTWHREPLGLVPFEAAAQGCIPILTAQAGAAEWLLADDCIKVQRTPEGLAGGMQRILYMPRAERAAMRLATSVRIRKLFTARRWFQKIERRLAALPDRQPGIDARRVQDAMFAITRMWRG
jgi:glycosyltransferase involved in cell wall biosynthesis